MDKIDDQNASQPGLFEKRRLALISAATFGDIAQLKDALLADVDLESTTSDGSTPLLCAALSNPRPEVSRHLLELGADILARNDDGESVLHGFARFGWLDLIEKALDAGCSINALDHEDESPLSIAAGDRQMAAVTLLCRRGASPFRTRSDESMELSISDSISLAAAIGGGLDVNVADARGATLLMHCSSKDDVELCEALLAQGASLEIADKRGWTPLAHAILNRAVRCFGLMLESGASVDFRTKENQSIEDLLAGAGNEIRSVLNSWRARNAMRSASATSRASLD